MKGCGGVKQAKRGDHQMFTMTLLTLRSKQWMYVILKTGSDLMQVYLEGAKLLRN